MCYNILNNLDFPYHFADCTKAGGTAEKTGSGFFRNAAIPSEANPRANATFPKDSIANQSMSFKMNQYKLPPKSRVLRVLSRRVFFYPGCLQHSSFDRCQREFDS